MAISSFRKWNNSFILQYTICNLGSEAIPQRSNRAMSTYVLYYAVLRNGRLSIHLFTQEPLGNNPESGNASSLR